MPDYTSKTQTTNLYTWSQNPSLDSLRTDEFAASLNMAYDVNTNTYVNFVAFSSNKEYSDLNSVLSICRTIFVCVVLSIASIMFTSDANTLVLQPIERMLEKVKLIAKNPLAAASDEMNNAGVLSLIANQ